MRLDARGRMSRPGQASRAQIDRDEDSGTSCVTEWRIESWAGSRSIASRCSAIRPRRCCSTSASRPPCRRPRTCGRSSSDHLDRQAQPRRAGRQLARRHGAPRVAADIADREVVTKLFDTIAPRYADRPGGYTRLLRLGHRRGDAADLAQVELSAASTTRAPPRTQAGAGGREARRRRPWAAALREALGGRRKKTTRPSGRRARTTWPPRGRQQGHDAQRRRAAPEQGPQVLVRSEYGPASRATPGNFFGDGSRARGRRSGLMEALTAADFTAARARMGDHVYRTPLLRPAC